MFIVLICGELALALTHSCLSKLNELKEEETVWVLGYFIH